MKLERLSRALYLEPAFLTPAAHRSLQSLFENWQSGGFRLPDAASLRLLADDDGEPDGDEVPGSPGDGDDDDHPQPAPVRVISVSGTIMNHAGPLQEMCAGACSTDRLQAATQAALLDATTHTLCYVFDSPGGQVAGTHEMAMAIRRAGELKNTVALIRGQCCSAAYYMASQCHAIISEASSLVGCVGAYLAWDDDAAKKQKDGVVTEVFRSGDMKAAGIGRPLTDEERAMYQAIADSAGAMFRATVSETRPEIAAESMRGQVFPAAQALALGFVDHITDDSAAVLATLQNPEAVLSLLASLGE